MKRNFSRVASALFAAFVALPAAAQQLYDILNLGLGGNGL